jgi:hypothetical protein
VVVAYNVKSGLLIIVVFQSAWALTFSTPNICHSLMSR